MIEKPYFPKRSKEDIYWPYLATVGFNEEDFSNFCVKEVEVVAIMSLTTVSVTYAGIHYNNVPVWIHTDIGARKSFYLTQEQVPENYFENSATIFPFPGSVSIKRYETPGNLEDTSTVITVAPKALCIFRVTNETLEAIAVISVVSNIDYSDVYTKQKNGLYVPQRTYKPYVLMKLFVDKIISGGSYIRIHTDYILYDMIEEAIAVINKYDNGPPNYLHTPIDEYITAQGSENLSHIKSFLTASDECFSCSIEYSQTVLVNYGQTRPGEGWNSLASSCKNEYGIVYEAGWLDKDGNIVDDLDHFRSLWVISLGQYSRYPYTATCFSGEMTATTSIEGNFEYLTSYDLYISKAAHVIGSDNGTIRIRWSDGSEYHRIATFSESFIAGSSITYTYTEKLQITINGELLESDIFTHVNDGSNGLGFVRSDSDIQYIKTSGTNLFHNAEFVTHFYNKNGELANNIILREEELFLCSIGKAIEVLKDTMEAIVDDIKENNPLYDIYSPLSFTAKIESFHYVPYDPRITKLQVL